MSDQTKDQRKALKTTITNAISAVLSKNKHFKDKKVQKAIEKGASDIAKKITKADKPKVAKPAKKVTKPAAVKKDKPKTTKITKTSSKKPTSN